ncbi:hypothetical protein [Noviherbaspirillum sp. ST9]|uniref:hypothetical protein n=1 Tax=Noviherbaspirillum sp. ST9 TaxID=3401606 RepID=UPI003B58AE58
MTGSSSARTTTTGTSNQRGAPGNEATGQWSARTDRAPGDPPANQRIEPRIDDNAFPQGPSSAYERLHGLGPEFGESGFQAPVGSRLRRVVMMASVFVVGAGVGLAAAWWFHQPATVAPISAAPASTVRSAPALPATEVNRSAAIRGISPSELPYDGAPPPAAGQSTPEPVASKEPALPEAGVGTSGANPSGERNAGRGGAEADAALSAAPPSIEQSAPQAAQAVDDARTTNASKATKQGGASVASTVPKRKSVARSDREIERIRRQVDEELKKKTEQGRGLSSGTGQGARNDRGGRRDAIASGAVSRVSATRASLARCDKKTNFIRREFCRWQVCNGSWGKNGCPSYQQQASTY